MAEQEEVNKAKIARRSAKGIFTRKRNNLMASIQELKSIEVIEDQCTQMIDAWTKFEGKHETYTNLLDDEDFEIAENWMAEVEKYYIDAKNAKINYAKSITDERDKERALKSKEDENSQQREQHLRTIEQTRIKRDAAQNLFKYLCNNVDQICREPDTKAPFVKSTLKQLEKEYANCCYIENHLLDLLSEEEAKPEIEAFSRLTAQYHQTVRNAEARIDLHEKHEHANDTKFKQQNHIQFEKVRMPYFNGEIRNYPQFKRDFETQVFPELSPRTASYTLRSCLGADPLAQVKSVDDDYNEMWKRLDDKYGDPSKVVDVIINEVKRFKVLREGDNKKFIEFVDMIEDNYRDLKRLGIEREITTTSSVSTIESKLPQDVRREWAKLISSNDSKVDKTDKFPSLLEFLLSQKRAIEYDTADLRMNTSVTTKGSVHHSEGSASTSNGQYSTYTSSSCLFHQNGKHQTSECKVYLSKTVDERLKGVKDKGACWSCLKVGHRWRKCRNRKECGVDECKEHHHQTLHTQKGDRASKDERVTGTSSTCRNQPTEPSCLLQIQKIRAFNDAWLSVMWDNASSLSFITNKAAKKQGLRGARVQLTLIKVGAEKQRIDSHKYTLTLIDLQGKKVSIDVYGIEKITSDIKKVDVDGIPHVFNVPVKEIERPEGEVDVLIGYDYAGFHPERQKSSAHLLLLKNRFGYCLGGTHGTLKENTKYDRCDSVQVNHVKGVNIDAFYNIENMGIECTPRCGGCKCGKCPPGGKEYTLKEERELKLVEDNLEYDKEQQCWTASYPWIKDPYDLPDNKRAAMGKLISTERRLSRNPKHAEIYQSQIQDMLDRKVARKLTREEISSYKGPVHYISHHDVLKDSKSTPVRIVFNSSANYMGHVLNEYWAKGPDLLNNLLGILIRFRENEIAFIGDVRKMYHTVKTKELEHHTHRFLWRDMDVTRDPDVYVIQRVSFGDKPSGTIATVAMRKTAEINNSLYPQASSTIIQNSYMDDIINSVRSIKRAKQLTENIEKLLIQGGFLIKGWVMSKDKVEESRSISLKGDANEPTEKVLGVTWYPNKDQLQFKVKCEPLETNERAKLTKRKILSQINRIYDPMGLAAPYTVRAKILMRKLWTSDTKHDWDDPISDLLAKQWLSIVADLPNMEKEAFQRCIKPSNATGDPTLVIFSDGSDNAYGACAYARWRVKDDSYESRLIFSKNRLAPTKKMSIDRIELCGAVLSKRLKAFLVKESRYKFSKCYHIVDSQIVYGMIQRESYGFNTFAATRIGEIQQGTNKEDWFWTESKNNAADCLTRGNKPEEIGLNSVWQKGPNFLKLPEPEWPIHKVTNVNTELPERIKTVMLTEGTKGDTLEDRINIDKYSKYDKLIRVTARILNMYRRYPRPTFRNAGQLKPDDIEKAERFWIMRCQEKILPQIKQGRFKRLCPKVHQDGVIVVGSRAEKWFEMSYNNKQVILLPYEHRFARLYAEHVHSKGHYGVSTTVSKIRRRFWITHIHRMVKSIKSKCIVCRKLNKKLQMQIMGKLPEERLKPSPPWYSTAIDLFGPFKIRDEVKKRTFGKCYGVIFNCMVTRAVHLDVASDYSTDKFLMVLRRFVSLRGHPAKIYSDNGTQLVAASKELKDITKNWNWEEITNLGTSKGFQWEFTPADAPWYNGVSEALIKSVKRALTIALGENILTFSEFLTVCYEVANLVNERPIGRHPTSPDDTSYLCPNDLLLGRSTSKAPQGPFKDTNNTRHRFEFVQNIIQGFWKKWTRDLFPNLIVQRKWHTDHRNVEIDDVVMLQDSNLVRGKWRLARVTRTIPSSDGKIRRVEVSYKNPNCNESVKVYRGSGYVTVERPVQRLVIVIPKEEQ